MKLGASLSSFSRTCLSTSSRSSSALASSAGNSERLRWRSSTKSPPSRTSTPRTLTAYRPLLASYRSTLPGRPLSSGRPLSECTRTRTPASKASSASASSAASASKPEPCWLPPSAAALAAASASSASCASLASTRLAHASAALSSRSTREAGWVAGRSISRMCVRPVGAGSSPEWTSAPTSHRGELCFTVVLRLPVPPSLLPMHCASTARRSSSRAACCSFSMRSGWSRWVKMPPEMAGTVTEDAFRWSHAASARRHALKICGRTMPKIRSSCAGKSFHAGPTACTMYLTPCAARPPAAGCAPARPVDTVLLGASSLPLSSHSRFSAPITLAHSGLQASRSAPDTPPSMMEKLRWLAALTTTSVVALEMSPSTTLTFVPLIVKLNRSVIAGADIEAS